MKDRLKDFLRSLREDYHFRTVYTARISALITFGFTIFNGVIGILYRSVWNISICIYYVLLAVVRRIVVRSQIKTRDKNQDKEIIKKTYAVTHIILILIDVALVVPIALMVIGARNYTFGMIPAIAMAAYTTYRMTMSIIHYLKSKRNENHFIRVIRTINMQDTLVSVLTLQNALIIANGNEMASMMQLTMWTSAGIWGIILFFTVKSFMMIRKV
ncbi:MAG: hypothetical protein Q4D51_14825 [Eubacteriales bacterium]|nr:hypothetical protein [Eubacteriales bacterium]